MREIRRVADEEREALRGVDAGVAQDDLAVGDPVSATVDGAHVRRARERVDKADARGRFVDGERDTDAAAATAHVEDCVAGLRLRDLGQRLRSLVNASVCEDARDRYEARGLAARDRHGELRPVVLLFPESAGLQGVSG